MENRKYFLANGIPNQPFENIRCFITKDDGGEYVMIHTVDLRLSDVESIANRNKLTPFPETSDDVVRHKDGLVWFNV